MQIKKKRQTTFIFHALLPFDKLVVEPSRNMLLDHFLNFSFFVCCLVLNFASFQNTMCISCCFLNQIVFWYSSFSFLMYLSVKQRLKWIKQASSLSGKAGLYRVLHLKRCLYLERGTVFVVWGLRGVALWHQYGRLLLRNEQRNGILLLSSHLARMYQTLSYFWQQLTIHAASALGGEGDNGTTGLGALSEIGAVTCCWLSCSFNNGTLFEELSWVEKHVVVFFFLPWLKIQIYLIIIYEDKLRYLWLLYKQVSDFQRYLNMLLSWVWLAVRSAKMNDLFQ